MKEYPIIFSGDHPRKILDRTKTMTRRTWGLERVNAYPNDWVVTVLSGGLWQFTHTRTGVSLFIKCPYGQVGDILIIKEAWAAENKYNHLKPSEIPQTAKIFYLSGEEYDPYLIGIKRSARFMCNWMSRARPEITELRAERLQEITLEDCKAEGIHGYTFAKACLSDNPPDPRWKYIELWDSLNAKRGYSWSSNPFIWVLSFRRLEE